MALFQRPVDHELDPPDRHIVEQACQLAKTDPMVARIYLMHNLPEAFFARQNESVALCIFASTSRRR